MQPEITKLYRQSSLGLFNNSQLIDHVELAEEFSLEKDGKNLAQKNTGKFYTPETIALPLIEKTLKAAQIKERRGRIRIIDPFCGDGRLIAWMLPFLNGIKAPIEIHLWDYDDDAVSCAATKIKSLGKTLNLKLDVVAKKADSFSEFFENWENRFDIVITNPPWEVVKPDPKDLAHVTKEKREKYTQSLKEFSNRLLRDFPLSRPTKAYGGWGVNLARVGTELSVRLVREGGVGALVTPATIFADQNSYELRKWMFDHNCISEIDVYPAELKLFTGVDQPSVSFILKKQTAQGSLKIVNHEKGGNPNAHTLQEIEKLLETTDYILPIAIASNPSHLEILTSLSDFAQLSELENESGVWMGRELDETNYQSWLSQQGTYRFVKGRDIDRFNLTPTAQMFVNEQVLKTDIPTSANYHRIVWRDVSRPTQKRRVIATIVPPGYVTGNSLGVLHIRSQHNAEGLTALLGLMSSFVFEFQLRAYLATAHVSAGVLRKVRVPDWNKNFVSKVSRLVTNRMSGDLHAEYQLEINIAQAYGLDRNQFGEILTAFPKVSENERAALLNPTLWTSH